MSDLTKNALTRRQILQSGALATGTLLIGANFLPADEPRRKPKVAAIFTELRLRSHAYNILENFFAPYLFDGKLVDPGCEVVSFYADQFPKDDMAREVSQRFKVPLYKTIDSGRLRGGKELAVDAVLLIGEHGDYPYNELGQHLYPRKEFFDQIVAVMRRSNRFVPLFNDKHLSYRWDWAREMYDTARRHGFPLMAGSSVPLGERRPPLESPAGAEIESVLTVHGGGREVYGYHGLELLQSIIEGRKGGEKGIRRVEIVSGDAMQGAADQGRWSRELLVAAMAAEKNMGIRRQVRPPQMKNTPATVAKTPSDANVEDHAILIEYCDGLQAAVLKMGSSSDRWNFACRLKGESQPRAMSIFNGPWGNRCMFKALSHAIQYLFVERREPYPIERTLLTTGATEAAMQSYHQGKPIDTPHLDIAYQAVDFKAFRESGASWKLITADTTQPTTFDPGDEKLLPRK